ncbi:MAG: GNAT family N-acetyltransferase [Pseudomonadota bacterium]
MATYPQQVSVRGGKEITLRPAQSGDEDRLIRFFAGQPEEDLQYLRHDVKDPEVIRAWFRDSDPDNVFALLALHGDTVIGDGTLHRNQRGWSPHVGEVRLVVAPDWQRQGVGQAILKALVARAVNTNLEIIEAQVLEGQDGARRAFETLGFHVEATLKSRARDRRGRPRDVWILTNDVSELWKRMEDLITDSEYRPASGA